MMRKALVFVTMLVLTALSAPVASADGNSRVVYTWTVNDLGQGVWGGGPLFDDGSAGGNFPLSFYNGQIIAHFQPVRWHEVVPGESIDICFHCLSWSGIKVFVSELPVEFSCYTRSRHNRG